MKKRDWIFAASLVAALAWTNAPASAQSVNLGGITGGNATASTGNLGGGLSGGGGGGSSATASTSGGSLLGGSGPTTGNVTVGGNNIIDGTGPATADVKIGEGTASGNPTGSIVIGTGSNPVNDGTTATVVLNPGGAVVGIDTNGDGVADQPVSNQPVSTQQIQTALSNLDNSEVALLKTKCRDVMSSPGAFDRATVALCATLAKL